MTTVRRRTALVGLAALALACAHGRTGSAADSVDALAWLLGTWVMEDGDTTNVERWEIGDGGTLVGVNETHVLDALGPVETLAILATDGGIVYRASPEGQPTHDFVLDASGDRWARFVSPGHDWPQSITYRRAGDTLEATVAGDTADGPRTATWRWTLAPTPSSP